MLNVIHASVHSGGYETPATRGSARAWHFGSEETFLSLGASAPQPEHRAFSTRRGSSAEAAGQRRPSRLRVFRWAHS